jgi:polar amino acid transport system substrate-binding protein
LLQKTEVWAQFSRRSPRASDVEKLTEAIDRLRQKGFFETLLTRYSGDSARY